MNDNDIIGILEKSGITIIRDNSIAGIKAECLPYCRGNYGFFTVKNDDFEAILLKGVYKDYLRVIKGSGKLPNEKEWGEVVKLLNDSEEAAGFPIKTEILISEGKTGVISAAPAEYKVEAGERRDFKIPRPLTSVEYSLPASHLTDEDVILSRGFAGCIFPEVLSPLTLSVIEQVPDVLNPIFISCDLKTSSPSVVPFYGRIMTNMTAFEDMINMAGIGKGIFRASFSPNLYIKKQDAPKAVNKSYFPVEKEEITELIDNLRRTIHHISLDNITENSLYDYPVKFAICAEYIFIKLAGAVSSLIKYFPDFSDMLSVIFKTRVSSLFFKKDEYEIPEFLDFASPVKKVSFCCGKEAEKIDDHLNKVSFFTRIKSSGKIKKIISEIHELLDLRDDIYIIACSFINICRNTFLKIGEFCVKSKKIKKEADIFLFQHQEIKRLSHNSFFGNAVQTAESRRRIYERYAAALMPTEIYGHDIEKCMQITEKMIIKALELAEFSPLSLFPCKNKEAVVTSDKNLDDYEGYIIAASSLSPLHLNKYKNAEGFILENMPLFGFTAEYACINEIPVFSGVRFAPLILNNTKVKISGPTFSKA